MAQTPHGRDTVAAEPARQRERTRAEGSAAFRRAEPWLYAPPLDRFVEVDVPWMRFITLDGVGGPDEPEFVDAVAALTAVDDALAVMAHEWTNRTVPGAPLETFWESSAAPPGRIWTLVLRQPRWLDPDLLREAVRRADGRQPLVRDVRLLDRTEGRCLQITRLGPRGGEGAALAWLHERGLAEHGLVENGPHHEIFLGDPRAARGRRLRTVLRQPVRPAP